MDEPTNESFFERVPKKKELIAFVDAFSYVASLVCARSLRRLVRVPRSLPMLHRFEQSIGGRAYVIEVRAVARDRWRAYIVRIPGVPTALMPFYGATPADAAQQLSNWLTKAYERVSKPGGSV